MIFEEIIIWFENCKNSFMYFLPERAKLEASLHLNFHHTIFSIRKRAIPLEKNWLNRVKSHKCSLFKLDKIPSICGSSLRVENERRIQAFLRIFLSLVYLLL